MSRDSIWENPCLPQKQGLNKGSSSLCDNSLSGDFLKFFRFILATSERDKLRVFSLRHRVFCEELGFFSFNHANRLEQDSFDDNSLHCLIEHRETGLAIGCLRVVMADNDSEDCLVLPVEEHCHDLGVEIDLDSHFVNRSQLCEISRVAIPRYFRTGAKDEAGATGLDKRVFNQVGRQAFPMVGISLNLCATALSGILERFHVLAMIEPRFQRLLARAGLRFEQVSPTVRLLGLRAAFYIDQRRAEMELSDMFRPLYAALLSDLKRQYAHGASNSCRLPLD